MQHTDSDDHGSAERAANLRGDTLVRRLIFYVERNFMEHGYKEIDPEELAAMKEICGDPHPDLKQ